MEILPRLANEGTYAKEHLLRKQTRETQTREHLPRKQNVSEQIRKRFCFRNKCLLGAQTEKHLLPHQCFHNIISSFAGALRL